MNSFDVSLFLTSLLAVFYFLIKKVIGKNASMNVLFILLLLMFIPGLFFDLRFWENVEMSNMVLFFLLLSLTAIPWIAFEKWHKRITKIEVTDKGMAVFSKVFSVVIVLCLFSYVYVMPYAIKSFNMGAGEVRGDLANMSVIPENILTTIGVAVSTLSPYYAFFFFVSLLHPKLRKFSFWLFVSSFLYIAFSMPFMARDGFITLPVFYIILYLIFKKSLNINDRKKVRKYLFVLAGFAGAFLMIYSLSRFYDASSGNTDSLLGGTWGYIYQQPYVFDRTLKYQHSWHGVDLRFPILNIFSGSPTKEVVRYQDFETMFGTMLSEFYSIGGYWSLFVFTGAFVLLYYFGLRANLNSGNALGIFIFFLTYLLLEVSGLFYFRYGGLSFNILFLFLTIIPIFLPNKLIIVNKNN